MINKHDQYVSVMLTNISLAYTNDNYIADKIMPMVIVQKDTAKIAAYGMDNLRVVESIRAQGSEPNKINHTVSISDHYRLQERALMETVTDKEIENADKPFSPKRDAVQNITDVMAVIKEKMLATVMSSTSVITQNTTLSGTDQWSDYDNSDPIGDIRTGIDTVFASTGKECNTVILSRAVVMKLVNHPDFISRVSGNKDITESEVLSIIKRTFIGIKNVYIGNANENSGVEGGTDALSQIWGKHTWVGYVEPNPTLRSRSFGFTYTRAGAKKSLEYPYEPKKKSRDVAVEDDYDQKIVDVNCMYFIKNAIA